jgi:hypothetical protein
VCVRRMRGCSVIVLAEKSSLRSRILNGIAEGLSRFYVRDFLSWMGRRCFFFSFCLVCLLGLRVGASQYIASVIWSSKWYSEDNWLM